MSGYTVLLCVYQIPAVLISSSYRFNVENDCVVLPISAKSVMFGIGDRKWGGVLETQKVAIHLGRWGTDDDSCEDKEARGLGRVARAGAE
jgi:hypothetical protein